MARVALVAGPDLGHLLPVTGLARALRRRGHQTWVATGAERRDAVAAAGATFIDLDMGPPRAPGADSAGLADIGDILTRRAGEMAPPLARALGDVSPDLVVVDTLTRAGALAAELLDVAWVELVAHHLAEPAADIPPVGLGRRSSQRPWRRLDDARIHRAQQRSVTLGRQQLAAVRDTLGLSGDGAPAARLLATLPGLEHPRRAWPARTFVVGAVADDPPLAPMGVPRGDAPLVVVTDSTASGVSRTLAGAALRGLRHAGVRIAVTSARHDLEAWPTGAVIGPAPHGPLLDAAAVAVGFGGGGFIAKALARGVPMVIAPLQGDQREGAARVRQAGAGLTLPLPLVTATTVRLAVLRVLTDRRFAQAASRLAAQARARGPDYAAGVVERLLAGALPGSTGPDSLVS